MKLSFGLLSPTIATQLLSLNLKFDKDDIDELEDSKRAMQTLHINDLITDTQMDCIKLKIFNRARKHVMAKNKLKPAAKK